MECCEDAVKINYEVRKRSKSKVQNYEIVEAVKEYLTFNPTSHAVPSFFKEAVGLNQAAVEFLRQNVSEINICEEFEDERKVDIGEIFIYELSKSPQDEEMIDNDNEDIAACQIWNLPNHDFHGLWETLHMDANVKTDLLNFSRSSLYFAEQKVSSNLVSWNKVILLHGPPGTGKTSLCKALAHKLAIRVTPKPYNNAILLEINAHSLFSKYFSESGKLVMKMFSRIKEYLEDLNTFVVILIDEVESLTAARSASKDEPSDAIRVVNSLLTQIDQLKSYPNAMIMTTSNVTGKIDLAFVDRADMKVFIGLPGVSAVYDILKTAVDELIRSKIISSSESPRFINAIAKGGESELEMRLIKISKQAQGLSGRALRKIPFIAHVKFIKSTKQVPLSKYLEAIKSAVQSELADRENMSKEVKL